MICFCINHKKLLELGIREGALTLNKNGTIYTLFTCKYAIYEIIKLCKFSQVKIDLK